jgi:hypothetical protein
MINSYSVGGDIDAWCTKCKLELGHTITALVDNLPKKVKCNTCSAQHIFRAKPFKRSRTKQNSSARKSRAKEATYQEYLSRLTGGDPANSTKYNIKGNFIKDEIIDHLSFGIGIVLSVINFNKINILFNCHLKFEELFIFTISTATKNTWSAAYTYFFHK